MGEQLIQLDAGKYVNKWKIEKKLGEGAFGAVYKCSSSDGKIYALKTEGKEEKIQLLKMEVFVLMELTKENVGRHFCKIEDRGQCDNFNYVVMTFVGKSLQDLRIDSPKKRYSMGCAISIGIQCLEALEDLHSIGYLHRDVKPANYTVGRAEMNELRKVYVLDFGMARKFAHDDGTIKKPRAVAGFRGTIKYAPISCHAQRELCRSDDVESWLYMCAELTTGKLPWRNLKDIDEVGGFKKNCRKDPKLLFGGCPRQYIDIMRLTDSSRFFDAPDYPKIYRWMRDAIVSTKSEEFPYDWEPEAIKKAEEAEKNKKKEDKVAAKTEKTEINESEKEKKPKDNKDKDKDAGAGGGAEKEKPEKEKPEKEKEKKEKVKDGEKEKPEKPEKSKVP